MLEGEGLDGPPQHADDVLMGDDHEQDEADGEGMADLSLCDASFSAKDSVPTSDHDRISKCTEGVRMMRALFCKNMILGSNIDFRLSIFFLVFGITGSTRRILTLRPLWEFSPLKNLLRYGNQAFFHK